MISAARSRSSVSALHNVIVPPPDSPITPSRVGVHERQRGYVVDQAPPVGEVDAERGHAEHRRLQVVEVAPVPVAGHVVVVRLAAVVLVAVPHPVDPEGDEPVLGHPAAVGGVRVLVGVAVLGGGGVAHDDLLAAGGVAVPAQQRRPSFTGREVGGAVDVGVGIQVFAHRQQPALGEHRAVSPLGYQIGPRPGRRRGRAAESGQHLRQSPRPPGGDVLAGLVAGASAGCGRRGSGTSDGLALPGLPGPCCMSWTLVQAPVARPRSGGGVPGVGRAVNGALVTDLNTRPNAIPVLGGIKRAAQFVELSALECSVHKAGQDLNSMLSEAGHPGSRAMQHVVRSTPPTVDSCVASTVLPSLEKRTAR